MPTNTNFNTKSGWTCPACNETLKTPLTGRRHMERWHPKELRELNPDHKITYLPCDVPGCNKLANNTRADFYRDHLSMEHGIDAPTRIQSTHYTYLQRKTMETLRKHIIQEATEFNRVNAMISQLEDFFATSPPTPPQPYQSRHGFNTTIVFETNMRRLPHKKADLVAYLQAIRSTNQQVGSLYTRPGVMDTRSGVLDDLESLLDEA